MRRAALPVGAQSSTRRRAWRAISTSTRCVCVLPAPGSPVSSTSGRVRTSSTTLHCSSETCTSGRVAASKSGAAPARARAPSAAPEPLLHLPELGAVDAVSLDDDLRLRDECAHGRLEQVRVADTEEAARVPLELVDDEEGVAVGLGLLEDEADTRAQALRVVELDAERPCDAVGVLEADAPHLGKPVRVAREHGDDVCAVLAHEAGGEAGPDAVGEEEALDLADRRNLAPRVDRPQHALPRDRAAGLRAHLAQALRVAVELVEDVLRAEVQHDRTREGGPDAGHAARQPELYPLRGLRQRGVERLHDELPAVARVLGERAGADELLARRDVSRARP